MTQERELKAKMMIAASLEHNIENGVWEGEDKEIAIEAAKSIREDIVDLNWELEQKY